MITMNSKSSNGFKDIKSEPEGIIITSETLPRMIISSFVMIGLTDCTLPYTIVGNCASRIMERGIQLGLVVPKYHCIGCGKFGPSLGMHIEDIKEMLFNDPISLMIIGFYLEYLKVSGNYGEHFEFLEVAEEILASH